MKILILASNPRKDLNLDREIRDLKNVIEASRNRQQLEVEDALAVRVGDLQNLFFRHEPQIVHFCGHGSGQQGLVFEGSDGGEQWVRAEALSDLFRLFSKNVGCVLLNACYSEEQANAIVNHIDYVIGMNQEIRDDAAIAFSKGFYRALGYECSIEQAYEFGKNAIQLEISGSSKMRSVATEEVVRKAEVVGAIQQIAIPEHLKPILKKKPALSPLSTPAPALSQETQTAIQLDVAQALTKAAFPTSLSAYDAQTWVGRDELIISLTQKLRDEYRILAITGITGIGKTALAERVVVEVYRDDTPFHRLNFDDRGQGRDFLSGALALLPKLNETVTTEDQKDPHIALKHLLQTLRQKQFLVQIDSLERLLQGDEQTGWNAFTDPLWIDFFQQLLAGETCQSQLLLTSQALSEELEEIGARYPRSWYRQDLGGLSEAEQLQLFEKYGLKPDGLGTEILNRFVELYQGHPLVMQVIASDILEKPFNGNVQQYWQRYQMEFEEFYHDRQRKGSSPRALQLRVKQRVEQSLQRLPADARQMLFRSAVYRRPVPEEFWLSMMADLSEDSQWAALELLKSHNLAEQELREGGVLLLRQHNLVRGVARKFLKIDEAMWQEAENTAAKVWLNDFEPEPDSQRLEQMRGKLEAFHHYCEVENWEAAKAILINQGMGDQLQVWGYFREMLPLFERLLDKIDSAVNAFCERCIGNAFFYLSDFPQAIEHYHQSLLIARRIDDRRSEGSALGGLSKAYWSLGSYLKAIQYSLEQLTIVHEIDDLLGEARALGSLGSAYEALGDYPQAIEYYQKQLVVAHKIGDRQEEGRALGGLGSTYNSQGNYPQAIEYLQQRLAIAREISDYQGEGVALSSLGITYDALGNYSQALEYHQQWLKIAREVGCYSGEATAQANWGTTLLKLESYSDAQQHLQTALQIFRETGFRKGEAETLLRMGELHYKKGQLDQAQKFCAQALTLASDLGIPLVKECEVLQSVLCADNSLNA